MHVTCAHCSATFGHSPHGHQCLGRATGLITPEHQSFQNLHFSFAHLPAKIAKTISAGTTAYFFFGFQETP